jgi:hypothetical protein
LGGTLGVAVIGSVYASLYANRLAHALSRRLPAGVARGADASVGAAFAVAGKLSGTGHPLLASRVHDAATSAFFHAFDTADCVAAGTAAAGALMALALLPAQPTAGRGDTAAMPALETPAAATSPR